MKRFVGVAVMAASLVTLAAVRPPAGGTVDGGGHDLSAFGVHDPDGSASTLVVEPEEGQADNVLTELVRRGVVVQRVLPGLIEVGADVPFAELVTVPGVRAVGPASRPVTSAATTLAPSAAGFGFGGEGVADVGAPRWHEAGILGAGTLVAVIDTGFGDWDIALAAGQVPSTVAGDINLCNLGLGGTNHGTATSEIVYDMAPSATLLRVCVDDAVDLAQAVPLLIARGVNVVNMSLGFFNTGPGNGQGGPGSPDASARAAVAAGIVWVNSAGNEALVHNTGTFTDTDGNGSHEWAAGDEYQRFDLPPQGAVDVYLKWDEWTGAPADDFALCLTDDPANPAQCTVSRVATRGLPTVAFGVRNPFTTATSLYVRVERRAGTGNPRLDAFFVGASAIEHPVTAGSLADPAAVPGIVTVGAYCTQGGRDLRPYSSQGPTLDGRAGVTLLAPGSVSGLLFGDVIGCQGGYGGTSAASPHVAGAAALISEDLRRVNAERPVTAGDIVAQLEMRTDRVSEGGPDPVFGYGRLAMGQPLSAPGGGPTTTTTMAPSTTTSTTAPGPTTSTTAPATTTSTTAPATTTTTTSTTLPPTTTTTSTTMPTTTTTVRDGRIEGVAVGLSDAPDRSDPRPLEGATLSGEAFLFLTPIYPDSPIDHVRFLVDGRLIQVERSAGYDVGGGQGDRAYGLDTFRVGDGAHELETVVVLADGSRASFTTDFRVDNTGRTRPDQPFSLVALGPQGEVAWPLDGAVVSGPVRLGLAGTASAPVGHVLFFVDAVQRAWDGSAPYAMGEAFDSSALGSGAQASQAVVFLADGRIFTVNATFTVS